MPLVPLYGHVSLRDRLARAADRGTLPASLLFHGPRGVGKQRLALWLGQLLLCTGATRPCGICQHCRYASDLTHPDLAWFFPRPRPKDADSSAADIRLEYGEAMAERAQKGGLYGPPDGSDGLHIGTVRAIVAQAAMSPALATRKVFVVGDAERMVPQEGSEFAANAFLKMLEEPPADTTLILTSSEPGSLLATIRSRVVGLRVPPVPDASVREFLADPQVVAALKKQTRGTEADRVRLAGGVPGRLLGESERDQVVALARELLEASQSADPAARYRVALRQGSTRSRGAFSDMLDALTVVLHGAARSAVDRGDQRSATAASRAVDAVETAKLRADGNVSPQLLSAALLATLTRERV